MDEAIKLKDIKGRIFKNADGVNNYMNVSIEEMDWLIEQTETLEEIKNEAEELYDEGIDLMDFGERVKNII